MSTSERRGSKQSKLAAWQQLNVQLVTDGQPKQVVIEPIVEEIVQEEIPPVTEPVVEETPAPKAKPFQKKVKPDA